MSKLYRFGLRTLSAVALFCAFTTLARCEESAWQTDFEAAKAAAKSGKKLILVDFTGSDWCVWCKKLRSEVFDKEPFVSQAPKQFVLVELDFPMTKKLPAELKSQNEGLSKQYKIHGFPTVLLLDADGEVVAHTGYRRGGPDKYVANLSKLVKLSESSVHLQEELASSKGVDRAKLLDQLVDAKSELDVDTDKVKDWTQEIIDLDADNKAGLKSKNEVRQMMAEFEEVMKTRKFDDAGKILDKILARPDLSGDQKQEALFAQCILLEIKADIRGAIVLMKQALQAAPNGPKADDINESLGHMEEMVKNEDAAVKAEADLAKAEGPERLKLLDQAIEAFGKIGNRIGKQNHSADVLAWQKEVVKLDVDNKAGLAKKYKIPVMTNDAQDLLKSHSYAEAVAMLDKILAVPGISPEEIDRTMMMKCNCLMGANDYQGAIDCATKAEKSAQGMMANYFKSVIKRAEEKLKAKADAGA